MTERVARSARHRPPGHQPDIAMIAAVPTGDDADLAEQSEEIVRTGPLGADIGDDLVGNREADPADLLEQRTPVEDFDDQTFADDRD